MEYFILIIFSILLSLLFYIYLEIVKELFRERKEKNETRN